MPNELLSMRKGKPAAEGRTCFYAARSRLSYLATYPLHFPVAPWLLARYKQPVDNYTALFLCQHLREIRHAA